MLVLCREIDQSIRIGADVKVTVVEIKGGRVRLGITAPPNVRVNREEVHRMMLQKHDAAEARDASGPAGTADRAASAGVVK